MGQVHQVGQVQVQMDPYYTVYLLQVAICVGQVHQVGQEQVQRDLLLHYLPAGGNLCGPGAPGGPGAGADRSPITLFTCRRQSVWGRCTRCVRCRCRQISYYAVSLQVATCVGQVHQGGQEQVQINLLLHYLPAGGNLCGAGAPGGPGAGADRLPAGCTLPHLPILLAHLRQSHPPGT